MQRHHRLERVGKERPRTNKNHRSKWKTFIRPGVDGGHNEVVLYNDKWCDLTQKILRLLAALIATINDWYAIIGHCGASWTLLREFVIVLHPSSSILLAPNFACSQESGTLSLTSTERPGFPHEGRLR